MAIQPNDIIKARQETENVRVLWKGMKRPINIIYEAWDSRRWKKEFKKMEMKKRKELDIHKILKKLENNDKQNIADWLVSIGPLVTTGDLFALQYVLLALVNMYNSKDIKLHDAWRLVEGYKNNDKFAQRILKENIILIGGPAGNPITFHLLKKLDLNFLFPEAPDNDLVIRKLGSNETMSPSIYRPKKNDTDYGIFLSGKNPWNDKSNFYTVMGCLSWGTQAAAALACSEEGAKMLLESKRDPILKDYKLLDAIGYVQVMPRKGIRLPKLVVPDCDLKMIWPQQGLPINNPIAILATGDKLKISNLNSSLFRIGFSPILLIISFIIMCFGVFNITFWLLHHQILPAIISFIVLIPLCIYTFKESLVLKE